MKKIALLLLFSLFSNIAIADCDFSTGITAGPNKTFIYSEECHLQVGRMIQDDKVKDIQISDLTKAITLKDLAITTADQRTMLWQKTSDDQLSRLNTIQSDQKRSDWLFFGLGAATMFLGAYAAAKIIHP